MKLAVWTHEPLKIDLHIIQLPGIDQMSQQSFVEVFVIKQIILINEDALTLTTITQQ